MITYRY